MVLQMGALVRKLLKPRVFRNKCFGNTVSDLVKNQKNVTYNCRRI